MLGEDPDLSSQGLNRMIFTKRYCVLARERLVSKMLQTGWRKRIPTLVSKSFLRRKSLNRFWLVTNQGRVAAVTQSGGGGETINVSSARLYRHSHTTC